MKIIAKLLFKVLYTLVARKRRPDQAIGRGTVYLYRWWLFGGVTKPNGQRHPRRIFGRCVYLHLFLRSDDDVLHDHPWDWWSLLLRNGYSEVRFGVRGDNGELTHIRHEREEGTLVRGRAVDAHRVELRSNWKWSLRDMSIFDLPWMTAEESFDVVFGDNLPVFSLFFMGKWQRDWGFHCPKGWRFWRDFTSGPHGDDVGAGCGELS